MPPVAERCPGLSRRDLLKAFSVAGLSIGGARGAHAFGQDTKLPPTDHQPEAEQAQPFYGRHQPGILTPPQSAALFAAFDVLAASREELDALLRLLTERAAFLMSGGTPQPVDDKFPRPTSAFWGLASTPST